MASQLMGRQDWLYFSEVPESAHEPMKMFVPVRSTLVLSWPVGRNRSLPNNVVKYDTL